MAYLKFTLFLTLLIPLFVNATSRPLLNFVTFKQKIVGPYKIMIDLQKNGLSKEDFFKTGLIVDHFHDKNKILAYATKDDLKLLTNLEISYDLAVDKSEETKGNNYLTHEEVTKILFDFEAKYPNLIKIYSIGKSVKKRDVWVAKISPSPEVDLPLTEINLKSTMHGDEIVGQEMLMKMIQTLLEGYEKDPAITKLINESEIFIIPNINYDGTALKRRGNANSVDLNRDFPDGHTSDNQNTVTGREIETQNIMNFTKERNFALAMNYHGGAVVVNYPWDAERSPHPENDLVRKISLDYSKLNSPMYNSYSFDEGITNGYNWYPIYGGMQDFSYFYYDTIEVTVEVSQSKWPSYSLVNKYWSENKDSLFSYMENAHRGLKGIVVNSETNAPIMANFKIGGIAKSFKIRSKLGDFTKPLLSGNYEITFEADGFEKKAFNISVDSNSYPTYQTFHLDPIK